jgi:hypothetical protein
MNGRCDQSHCYPDSTCALGCPEKSRCEYWKCDEKTPDAPPSRELEPVGGQVSWSGRTLGTHDLIQVAARGPLTTIGIVGPAEAGKTTFLMHLYLQLLQGRELAGGHFSGSLTLGAWESIAGYARWSGDEPPAGFPPHTTSDQTRAPGLLHVALRMSDGRLHDVVFTTWMRDEEDPHAEGARWIARLADGFLIFADSARLAGPERGAARGQLRGILERLRGHVARRPVHLVWAKADNPVPEGIAQSIRASLKDTLSHAREAQVTNARSANMLEVASAILIASLHPPLAPPILTPVVEPTAFGTFRGHT